MTLSDDDRHRLERKMKRAKREAEDLEDQIAQERDDEKKRQLTRELEDAETKARRYKRKLR